MYKKLVVTRQYVIGLIITLVFGLTPLLWFKGHLLAGEEFYALDYAKWGKLFSNAWFSTINFGEFGVLLPFKFQQLFFEILYFLGASKLVSLVFWHTTLFILTAVSFYSLLIVVFKERYNAYTYVLATMYYTFNPYFLNISVYLSPPKILFAILPAVFIVLHYLQTNQTRTYFKLFVLVLLLTFSSPIFVNIPLGVVFFSTVFLCLVGLGYPVFEKLKILAFFTFFYIALNAWWLVPTLYKQLSATNDLKSEAADFSTIARTNTADVLSLFGSWAIREKIYGTDYYYFSYNTKFDDFAGAVTRFLPFVILIGGIFMLIKRKPRLGDSKYIVLCSLAGYVLFIVLSKGTNAPFGFVYNFLYTSAPFFWMFREPYAKFMPFASFFMSILLVFGLDLVFSLANKISNISIKLICKIAFYGITTFVFCYLAYPFISSQVIWQINDGPVRSHLVKIPLEWEQLTKDWKPELGYYFVPTSQENYDKYLWPSGYNGNPFIMLTDAKILSSYSGYSASENPQRKILITYILSNLLTDSSKFFTECNRYNLSGLIFQNDIYHEVDSTLWRKVNEVKTSLNKNISFENSAVKIINCEPAAKQTEVSVVPSNQILSVTPQDFSMYHVFRGAPDNNAFYKIEDNKTSDVLFVAPQEQALTSAKYNLGQLDKSYQLYMYSSLLNVNNTYLDNKLVNTTKLNSSYTVINNETSAKSLSLQLTSPATIEFEEKNSWYRLDKGKKYFADASKINVDQVYLDDSTIYLYPLASLSKTAKNAIIFSIGRLPVSPIGASLVLKDRVTGALTYYANYKLPADSVEELLLPFDPIESNLPEELLDGQFFLALYGFTLPTNQQYPSNIQISPKNIRIQTSTLPTIFAAKKIPASKTFIVEPEIKQIDTSTKLVHIKPDETQNRSIILKQSYNKDWRMITLTKQQFEAYPRVNKISLLAQSLKAKNPFNIEYYANGWELNSNGDVYMALVFWPSLLANVLGSASLGLFAIMTVVFVAKYKKL